MLATAQVLADWDWEVGHGAPRCPLQAATHGTPRKVGLGHTFTHTHTHTHIDCGRRWTRMMLKE